MKSYVFDITQIPFVKRSISISSFTVEIPNDQNLFIESNLGSWFSIYVQVCSGELKLLGRVEDVAIATFCFQCVTSFFGLKKQRNLN